MATQSLRLALIGFGYWGKKCASSIEQVPGVHLRYLVTSQQNVALSSSNTVCLTKWQDLLSVSDVDGVIIAAPSHYHYEIAKAFIKQKIPVFIEKPMALSVKHATELVALAKQFKSNVIVDHILLFSPAFKVFSKYLKEHKERLTSIEMISGKWKPYPEDISMLWEWAPHEIAMCYDLFDAEISINDIKSTTRKFKQTYGQSIQITGEILNIPITLQWSNVRKKPVRKIIATFQNSQLIFNDKIDSKVLLKQHDGQTKQFSFDTTSALKFAITSFKEAILDPKISFQDVELGFSVTQKIDKINRSLSKI